MHRVQGRVEVEGLEDGGSQGRDDGKIWGAFLRQRYAARGTGAGAVSRESWKAALLLSSH